ncbi:hypothetical protein CA54_47660 [Symmachiella macrocystis]|uniref:Uncharacterized protein n=1 Tax=Symmachiella macrocystis TaxID=2527985 RepID=A0A5C6BGF4_9PLAN|nr:hypothetical protein [Symmachiella macrocystis]TWU09524.1 hypothetical protein CA54_47660 [Symmachiella macrocystis]
MNIHQSSESTFPDTLLPQQVDLHELKRRMLITTGKVCVYYAGLHFLCWFLAFAIEPFRFTFYTYHSLVALLIALVRLTPVNSLFTYGLVTLPVVTGCVHMLVVGAGGLLGGRYALRHDPSRVTRGVYRGGIAALAILVLVNALTSFCLWYFHINLTDL